MRSLTMPNIRQYRYLHKGENEWLSEPPVDPSEEDQKAWDLEWKTINEESEGIKIEFTEDMYTNSEYSDLPEFINVTIKDEYILEYTMARGVIKAIDHAKAIVFSVGIDCYTDDGWGNIGYEEISITASGAWITITGKHSNEEVEVDVSEQFNQAIGETA
jgi:hypothetical protein